MMTQSVGGRERRQPRRGSGRNGRCAVLRCHSGEAKQRGKKKAAIIRGENCEQETAGEDARDPCNNGRRNRGGV